MRDLYSNIGAAVALPPAVQAASINGSAVSVKDFGSLCFAVVTGAIVGAGDFGAKVQESDTNQSGDFTDAAAAVVDTNAPATLAADSAYRLGYRGNKPFARVVLTKAGGTSIAAGAVAVKGNPADSPVA